MNSRLTALGTVYFQQEGEQPVATTWDYVAESYSKEQHYVRKLRVTDVEQQLDFGWVKKPLLLLLVHDGPPYTDKLQAPTLCDVVVYVNGMPFATLRNKRSLQFEPVSGAQYSVRSLGKEARLMLAAFPE